MKNFILKLFKEYSDHPSNLALINPKTREPYETTSLPGSDYEKIAEEIERVFFAFAEEAAEDLGSWVYRQDLGKWQHWDIDSPMYETREFFERWLNKEEEE